MKLSCAIVSCDDNLAYLSCWPLVKEMWNKIVGIQCKLILVAKQIPDDYIKYSDDIILFTPIKKIRPTFIAQCIRYLYPCLMRDIDGAIIVSDMDMVPLNKEYFIDSIKKYDDDLFISYRNLLENIKQIAICYNVATPKTYSEIFNIHSEIDLIELLRHWYSQIVFNGVHNGKGWTSDQQFLYKYVIEWNKNVNKYVALNDNITNFSRLSRGNPILDAILNDTYKKEINYCDFHMLMPFYQYENENVKIINKLITQV